MSKMTLERGILFLDDGTEVSNVSLKLIKAAPDMLKALKALVARAEDCSAELCEAIEVIGRVEKKEPYVELESTWSVDVIRTGYGSHTFTVQASSMEAARQKALEMAHDTVFSEKGSEYTAEDVWEEFDE